MIAPVHRLKKSEIIWLANHRCKHSHTYLEHYQCYEKEVKRQERVGFIDIETSNLSADFGIMLCYCILDDKTGKIYHYTISKEELSGCLDKKVVEHCIEDMKRFDKLIGHYSTKFDIPFIRTRALNLGVEFPNFGSIKHKDSYYIIKNKFRLHSNRLENACRVLIGETQKTHLEAKYWIKALQGDRKSLAYILDHCKKDVEDLRKVYKRVEDFVGVSNTSI